MSRAVSGVFGTTMGSPSAYSTAKSQEPDAEGSSFGEALDRAQTNQSSDSSKPAAAAKSEKSSKNRPNPSVKKAPPRDQERQLKAAKSAASQAAQDLESDAGQGGAESEPDPDSGETDKQTPKKNALPDGTPEESPAAIVQIQDGSSAQAVQPIGGSLQKDGDAAKRPPKNSAAGAAKANVSTTKDGSATEAPSDPPASDGPSRNADASPSTAAQASERSAKSRLAIQPKNAANFPSEPPQNVAVAVPPQLASAALSDASQDPAPASQIPTTGPAVPAAHVSKTGIDDLIAQAVAQPQANSPVSRNVTATDQVSGADDPQASPEAQFSDANHPKIVSGITGRLLPNGGAMQIRLDPPELGAMQVKVEMRDGVMTASFETSNDQATRLLSHSLGDLRTALEAQGVSVQKLQVSQSPRQHQPSTGDGQKDNSQTPQDTASQREQQRREMVRRMWQKLMGGQDPVDLVA